MQSPSICPVRAPQVSSLQRILSTEHSPESPSSPRKPYQRRKSKRHLKKIRGANTIWEPFSSPPLLSMLCQYSSNESSCLPAANVTACVCHLAGGVSSAPKAAFSNTLLSARMTGHRSSPWAVQGSPMGWLSGQEGCSHTQLAERSFPGQTAPPTAE